MLKDFNASVPCGPGWGAVQQGTGAWRQIRLFLVRQPVGRFFANQIMGHFLVGWSQAVSWFSTFKRKLMVNKAGLGPRGV